MPRTARKSRGNCYEYMCLLMLYNFNLCIKFCGVFSSFGFLCFFSGTFKNITTNASSGQCAQLNCEWRAKGIKRRKQPNKIMTSQSSSQRFSNGPNQEKLWSFICGNNLGAQKLLQFTPSLQVSSGKGTKKKQNVWVVTLGVAVLKSSRHPPASSGQPAHMYRINFKIWSGRKEENWIS